MKANRLAKDEGGADSSDAIIILALVLGLLLVLVYIGHSLGGWTSTIPDWAGEVVEGTRDWAGEVVESFTAWHGASSTIEITEEEENTFREMYAYDTFILTANNTQYNFEATLSYEGDTYRRYDLVALGNATSTTDFLFGDAGERLFGRVEIKTFTISGEAMQRLERIAIDETLTLQGENYTMKITARGPDIIAHYTLEIRNESATENT